jgi:hypothetical protein
MQIKIHLFDGEKQINAVLIILKHTSLARVQEGLRNRTELAGAA